MARKKNTHQALANTKFHVIGLWVSMDTTEDFYEEGAIGGDADGNVLWETNIGTFDSLESLIAAVAHDTGASSDPTHWEAVEDGRIATAFTVDENNTEPTKRQIEEWKRGEARMWVADVSVSLLFANTWKPDEDTLNQMTILSKKASNPATGPAQAVRAKPAKKLKNKLMR